MTHNQRQKQKRSYLILGQNYSSNPSMADAPLLMTLTDDVLSEIILWAIALAKGRPNIYDAPINLSQTCRSLRALMLSQSRFWTHINLTPSRLYYGRSDALNSHLRSLWLTRSGNSLLDMSIDLYCGVSKDRLEFDAMSMLASSQSRWERLVLRDHYWPSAAYECPLVDLSQLRELDIENITMKSQPSHFFLNGSIKLSIISAKQTPIAMRLVHLHITSEFVSTSRENIIAMLDHCPALECLNCGSGESEHVFPLVHSGAYVGPSGTNNRLSRIRVGDRLGLLSLLNGRVPALEAIEIRIPHKWMDELTAILRLPHIGPLLRRVSLEFHSVPEGHRQTLVKNCDRIYEAIPNVTHLYLYPTPFCLENARDDLQSFSFEETGRGYFPALECLRIRVADIIPTRPLESMLASRMSHDDRFRAIIDTREWSPRRSKAFAARERIKSWVNSGRLEVILGTQRRIW